MPASALSISCICISFAISASAHNVVSLSAAAKATNAPALSQIIQPSFAGMGIEPSNLYSFTGGSTANQLTVNLMANLANYTGVPPHLRIGGNTEDNMIYDGSYNNYDIKMNPNPIGQGNYASDLYIFGPKFFEVLNRFPTGTPITYGLNLAYQDSAYGGYINRVVAEASAALTGLTNVDLVSFEIGNEPDLYLQNGFRNGTWNYSVYGPQWEERAAAVYEQVLRPAGIPSNYFEPGCTASTIGTTFQISKLDQTPISQQANATTNTSYISAWNQHDYFYYIGVSGYPLTLDRFMDLSQTYAQLGSWLEQIKEAFATGYPYVLREMASVGPTGLPGISDVFGATLWQLNFFLWTASQNITSVQMHMTDNSFAAPWQPGFMYNTGPYVRSSYYAWAAMDQLIGRSCTTQVAAIPINQLPNNYPNRLSAFGTYQQGNLAAIVLINTKVSNISETNKANITFSFSIPALAGKTVYLSYLTNDGADAYSNTTWNGLSYEISGNGTPTTVSTNQDTVVIASDGSFSVSVRDSSAVVANVGFVVGSGTVNTSACKALSTPVAVPSEIYTPPSPTRIAAVTTAPASANTGVLGVATTALSAVASASSTAKGAGAMNSPPTGMSFLPVLVFAAFVAGMVLRGV